VDFVDDARAVRLRLIGGAGHYDAVIGAVLGAERSVWIATANLKELMVKDHRAAPGRRRAGRATYRSVLDALDELAGRGVELRLMHAAPPSRPFRAALARHARLARGALAMRLCPRLHFKAVVVDGAFLYLGSANWTGAGLGAKGTGRRNFELGFATADDLLLDRVQSLYDRVWTGGECRGCKLREQCPAPLDELGRAAPGPAAARAAGAVGQRRPA
jgi:phosphatidylserine/phosphatidylglycerophosphate/cardiolipin synthase-like enzyme